MDENKLHNKEPHILYHSRNAVREWLSTNIKTRRELTQNGTRHKFFFKINDNFRLLGPKRDGSKLHNKELHIFVPFTYY